MRKNKNKILKNKKSVKNIRTNIEVFIAIVFLFGLILAMPISIVEAKSHVVFETKVNNDLVRVHLFGFEKVECEEIISDYNKAKECSNYIISGLKEDSDSFLFQVAIWILEYTLPGNLQELAKEAVQNDKDLIYHWRWSKKTEYVLNFYESCVSFVVNVGSTMLGYLSAPSSYIVIIDTAPIIFDPSFSPKFGDPGTQFTWGVHAKDDVGVRVLTAWVYGPDGNLAYTVPMNLKSGDATDGYWEGILHSKSDDMEGKYSIEFVANDASWNSVKGGGFALYLGTFFNIIPIPEKLEYESEEKAKVTIGVKNIGNAETEIWLGTTFKDPEGNEYDRPLKYAVVPKGETKLFTIDWTIPSDVPSGQYEIAVNCWKDAGQNKKYPDDLEWVPIFNVGKGEGCNYFTCYTQYLTRYPSDLFRLCDLPEETLLECLERGVCTSCLECLYTENPKKCIECAECLGKGFINPISALAECALDPCKYCLLNIYMRKGENEEYFYDFDKISVCKGYNGEDCQEADLYGNGKYFVIKDREYYFIAYRDRAACQLQGLQSGEYYYLIIEDDGKEYAGKIGEVDCKKFAGSDYKMEVNFYEISLAEKGLNWLRTQQKTDGDHVYWTYKGTPNVGITALVTLAFLNHGYDESYPTVNGALNWLVAQANDADGSISCDTRKVYDTSLAILPLVAAQNEAKYGNVKANARNYLLSVQNNEGTGYDHSDRFYGGWSYPKDNWADLSNTQFVVMALDATGGLTGKVKDNALTFVTRCQNRKESNSEYSSYDDGGFIYQPKSGGTSYGSMTAAGLWGLFLCGVDKNDGRLTDGLGWLDERSVKENDPIGNKWVYYYDLGLAKAYLMAEARGCEFEKKNWYEDLYAFLSDKQDKEDGHWHNIEGENSCDVLATAEAILALSVKEVPERISRLSYMVFKLRSAADLHIYDPEGRHVGLNTETGEVEIGIPDATYTENPIEIKVPNLKAGGYKAVLIGTEAGEYKLEVIAKTGNKTLAEASYEGWITEGATQEMVTTISSIVGPLDVRIGTLKAVVEAEDSYSEQFSLDAGDELEIDAIDETGVLLRIEAEEDGEGEIKIMDYSENPTIKGFPGEYKYCALEKYVDISLDVDREKIDWPVYLEVHYDKDELPENVDESTLTMYHYLNDTKWRSCNDFEVNPEENYISAELEKDELCYFGMGGLYAPIWVRYSMILAVMAIMIVLALGYFSVRRFVKSRRVKAMKVPERVPAKVAITIYNFDNSFSLLNEREETTKISDGLDGRLASGEIKEETYNDLNSKYESKIGDLNRKIKSDLERAKAYLQRIEDERTKLQRTHESLNAELQKEKGRKKKAEISAKVAGISAELDRVDGNIKSMKEKIGVIEGEFSGE